MRLVFLLIAAVVAIGAGIFALQWSGKQSAPAPVTEAPAVKERLNVNTVDVLVAKQPVGVGTVINESMIDKQPWPEHLVLEGFIVSGSKDSDLIGKVSRGNFLAREPFIANKLANPNDPSFLAAALPEGMRAVTMATDAIAGVAGYVFPGDRVDILFTHDVPAEARKRENPVLAAQAGDKPGYTEVLAQNVRVLAVNVREPSGKEAAQSSATPTSVTVEIDAAALQKLRLAEKNGTLSLALRSLKDIQNPDTATPTSLGDLTRVSGAVAAIGGVKIVRGVGHDSPALSMGAPFMQMPYGQ